MTNNILDITVLPYRSLSKKNFRNLMIIVSIIFFSIGVFFWSLGAWPVFGFLGLDVLLLFLAFKINYKKGEIFENLKLLKSNLIITRVFPSGKSQKWSLEPYWTINHGWITGMYYKDPDGNLVELFFEHWTNDEEYKNEISARGFPEEPVGTNMDIDILFQMYKNGESLKNLTKKGNTVPKGKRPVAGIQAAINMRKKFK